jgi:NAD(P)-dependent dehydrogenase (short-subunit alcohol dehydrogenase family)
MRKILITGGTGLIGSQLVIEMVKDNHFVMFTSRSKKAGEELISKHGLNREKCLPIELDFSKKDALDKLKNQLVEMPDTIIQNARSLEPLSIDQKGRISNENFQKEFFNGIIFPYNLINFLLDQGAFLKDIIFISSIYGSVAPNPVLYKDFENQSPINYGVVKAAQIHLTKELAVRLAHKKTRVNAISYGGVEGRVDKSFEQRYSKLSPNGRMLNHKDLYPPVQYFLNNPVLNVTGENLKVDGGWTIW